MKVIKKVVRFGLIGLLLIIMLLTGFFGLIYFTKGNERKVASEVAYDVISAIIVSNDRQREIGMPLGAEVVDPEPDDIDMLFRKWQFWYECRPDGSVLIELYPKRGMWIFSFFNRKQDLEVVGMEYVK